MKKTWHHLTVGKLRSFLNNIPDESNIWFWTEKDNCEVILNDFSITYHTDDEYEIPDITFTLE